MILLSFSGCAGEYAATAPPQTGPGEGVLLPEMSGHAGAEFIMASLPEEIYTAPAVNHTANARVGVFPFSEPDYAPGTGSAAGRILCGQLQKGRAFREVIFQPEMPHMPLGDLTEAARRRGLDLIITGRLNDYFEGSAFLQSRVSETIQVISVQGGKPGILWHAKARETGSPARSMDLIFLVSQGQQAPSAKALMKRNAEKFCNMILWRPRQRR